MESIVKKLEFISIVKYNVVNDRNENPTNTPRTIGVTLVCVSKWLIVFKWAILNRYITEINNSIKNK